MAKIALTTVKALVNFLQHQGIPKQPLQELLNVDDGQLHRADALIEAEYYDSLLTYAEHYLQRPCIGFECGQYIGVERWGLLGYIAATAPTLAHALTQQSKYQSLVGDLGTPVVIEDGDLTLLKWLPAYACSRHVVEDIISSWMALADNLSVQPVAAHRVYFSHACVGNKRDYERFFACEVVFEHHFNGLSVATELLQQPLAKHDVQVYQALCQQAQQLLQQQVNHLPVVTLSRYISYNLATGVPEIEDAAQHLQMSVRTLQRKLSEQHLSFSGLVESIRQELSQRYLIDTNTRIVDIAHMLGFSEQSAFQRAVKRWYGVTPNQFRQGEKGDVAT